MISGQINESELSDCVRAAITEARSSQIQKVDTLRLRLKEKGFDEQVINSSLSLIGYRLSLSEVQSDVAFNDCQ